MPTPGTDPETILARTTVVSLAVQALLERLLLAGTLTADDLVAMRKFGLDLTEDLREHGATGARGDARWQILPTCCLMWAIIAERTPSVPQRTIVFAAGLAEPTSHAFALRRAPRSVRLGLSGGSCPGGMSSAPRRDGVQVISD